MLLTANSCRERENHCFLRVFIARLPLGSNNWAEGVTKKKHEVKRGHAGRWENMTEVGEGN